MLASGSSAPLVIQSVFSDEEGCDVLLAVSLAHLMATAAIGAYPYLQLQIVGSAMRPLQQPRRASHLTGSIIQREAERDH